MRLKILYLKELEAIKYINHILIYISFLWGINLSLEPQIHYNYINDGGELSYSFNSVQSISLGVIAIYESDNLEITSSFFNNVYRAY